MFLRLFLVMFASLVGFLPASAQELVLGRNFRPDPMQVQGNTAGQLSLAVVAGSTSRCRGFGAERPNHVLSVTESFPQLDLLAFTPNVNQDLTMLVKGPGGAVWCGDDEYRGRSPRVSARLPKGVYQIWVGSGEPNRSVAYTLSISETPHK